MGDAERIWKDKSDEDLLDAAAELDQFTEEGQRIIREELKRRGLEDPLEQAAEEEEEDDAEGGSEEDGEPVLECLRCRAPLARLVAPEQEAIQLQWRGHPFPVGEAAGRLDAYACPRCGHVELFVVLPEDDESSDDRPE